MILGIADDDRLDSQCTRCFKFRNRFGMDVVLEALELYHTRKTFLPGKLMEYARICRVANVMAPYLEAKREMPLKVL